MARENRKALIFNASFSVRQSEQANKREGIATMYNHQPLSFKNMHHNPEFGTLRPGSQEVNSSPPDP